MRILPVLILAFAPTALWAGDIALRSDVTAVTLYPQGATVTREVPFEVPPGRHALILTDLPETTPLASVRVAVDGAVMGSVTARNDFVPPRDDTASVAIEAAKAEVERLEDAVREGEADVQAIRLKIEAAAARVAFLRQIGDSDDVAGLGVDALRDLAGMIGEETLAARQAAHEAGQQAGAADRALDDLREDLKEARQALAALVPEEKARAMLAVSVTAEEAAKGVVTVTYNIERAGWQPVYDLRLDRAGANLQIDRGAFVQQATGENWEDVALTLSTVRPTEQTVPSEVWPWLRRIEDPAEIRRKQLERVKADSAVAGALMEEPVPAPAAEEAMAVFDGLAVTYQYPGPVSVASKADRVRLTLGTLATGARLSAQAVPLSDATAFLVSDITNDTGELILPTGEANYYLDGRFIGRRYQELIPAGGDAKLSFGPVDGLRLTRRVLDRNQGDRGVLTRSNELTEAVRIEVENLTGERWSVRLLDRVPYSEQEDLEIEWSAQPEPAEEDVDGKRGVLAWEFDIGAGETQVIRLEHDLQWPEGQVLR